MGKIIDRITDRIFWAWWYKKHPALCPNGGVVRCFPKHARAHLDEKSRISIDEALGHLPPEIEGRVEDWEAQ